MRSVQAVLSAVQDSLKRANQEAYESGAHSVMGAIQTAQAQLLTLLAHDSDHLCEGDTCAGCFLASLEAYRKGGAIPDDDHRCAQRWNDSRCVLPSHHGGRCEIRPTEA